MKYDKNESIWIFITVIIGMIIIAGLIWFLYETKEPPKREIKIIENQIMTLAGFTVYAYCPCEKCNTKKWKGMLTEGKSMKFFFDRNINVCAVDPDVIPLGSKIIYNNIEYLAADVGQDIKGKTIDLLLKTHEDTLKFGVKRNQKITLIRGN